MIDQNAPMKPTLDPEVALSGPLYLVSGMLFIVPVVDFLTGVATFEPSSYEWRFRTFGLLSNHILLPVVGIALALVVAAVTKQYSLQRALVVFCLTIAVALATMTFFFLSDLGDARLSVSGAQQAAFAGATNKAIVRLVLATAATGYLGWRARRMIPSTTMRHKAPKPVHVISK